MGKEDLNAYLIVGQTKNWITAFRNNPVVWGFTEKERYAWETIKPNDLLFFHAAGEARGIIGNGLLLNKFLGDKPYWEREIKENRVIWKYRFYIKPIEVLDSGKWLPGKGPIVSKSFGIEGTSLQGKQIIKLEAEQITKIKENMVAWQIGTTYKYSVNKRQTLVDQISESAPTTYIPEPREHTNMINIVEDMGRIQNFYAEREFTIPGEQRRMDVIWKREVTGAPTYAFEIELSGGLDKAINKLNRCHKLWNTEPRLIVPNDEIEKAKNIIKSLDNELREAVIPVSVDQIKNIYEKKKEFKRLEMGIKLF